jgi:hypothetical protein
MPIAVLAAALTILGFVALKIRRWTGEVDTVT